MENTTIKCRYANLILDYTEQKYFNGKELTAEKMQKIEAHLKYCEDCYARIMVHEEFVRFGIEMDSKPRNELTEHEKKAYEIEISHCSVITDFQKSSEHDKETLLRSLFGVSKDCEKYQELIFDYAEQNCLDEKLLTSEEYFEVKAHLYNCLGCQESYVNAIKAIKHIPTPEEKAERDDLIKKLLEKEAGIVVSAS